jgi:hypothetical protein
VSVCACVCWLCVCWLRVRAVHQLGSTSPVLMIVSCVILFLSCIAGYAVYVNHRINSNRPQAAKKKISKKKAARSNRAPFSSQSSTQLSHSGYTADTQPLLIPNASQHTVGCCLFLSLRMSVE